MMDFVAWGSLDAIDKVRVELVPCANQRQRLGHWPEWLHEQAQGSDVDLTPVPREVHKAGAAGYRIIGLARLSSRGVILHRGALTNPDREGRLLLDVYRDPLDSLLLKVVDSVALLEPINVEFRQRQGRQRLGILFCFVFVVVVAFCLLCR